MDLSIKIIKMNLTFRLLAIAARPIGMKITSDNTDRGK
jgi:hypothetical protein